MSGAIASFLRRAVEPLSAGDRAAFARDLDADPADLEGLVTAYLEDGVLVRSHR